MTCIRLSIISLDFVTHHATAVFFLIFFLLFYTYTYIHFNNTEHTRIITTIGIQCFTSTHTHTTHIYIYIIILPKSVTILLPYKIKTKEQNMNSFNITSLLLLLIATCTLTFGFAPLSTSSAGVRSVRGTVNSNTQLFFFGKPKDDGSPGDYVCKVSPQCCTAYTLLILK